MRERREVMPGLGIFGAVMAAAIGRVALAASKGAPERQSKAAQERTREAERLRARGHGPRKAWTGPGPRPAHTYRAARRNAKRVTPRMLARRAEAA